MRKPLFSFLYVLSVLGTGLTIHQALAQRSPSVEPITEVSIEENRPARSPGQVETGFDFADKKAVPQILHPALRVPANITTKSTGSPYSYIGPMIFLLALPFALWIAIAKKIKNVDAKKVDYYSKTYQFKPSQTDYQKQDMDDDQDYPKAS